MKPAEIKKMREAFGMSQRDLARALRVAPLTVARWESNTSRPVGLQLDVLSALHLVAMQRSGNLQWIGMRLRLGVGAFLAQALVEDQPVP